MRTNHSRRAARRAAGRTDRIKNLVIVVLAVALACVVLLRLTATRADAEKRDVPTYKYYTSITVDQGDTLWGLADEYMSDEYDNVYEYMDEIVSINHLTSADSLKAGSTICIPYYSTEYKS